MFSIVVPIVRSVKMGLVGGKRKFEQHDNFTGTRARGLVNSSGRNMNGSLRTWATSPTRPPPRLPRDALLRHLRPRRKRRGVCQLLRPRDLAKHPQPPAPGHPGPRQGQNDLKGNRGQRSYGANPDTADTFCLAKPVVALLQRYPPKRGSTISPTLRIHISGQCYFAPGRRCRRDRGPVAKWFCRVEI